MQTQNWLVRAYDVDDNILLEYTLKNRTQQEAIKEVESEVENNSNARIEDWTIIPQN